MRKQFSALQFLLPPTSLRFAAQSFCMYCNYDSLHFTSESCIVRCRQCGFYKIAFLSFVISLSESEYKHLYRQIISHYEEGAINTESTAKNIFIVIPSKDLHLMLTGNETVQLYNMMEEADCEIKTLQMISLFEV